MKSRAPRDRGRITPPPPSSVGGKSPKVPSVHMASLVTTAQNWPLVPNPSSKPTVGDTLMDAVEKAAARSPRMSIDVELDFDDPAPPVLASGGVVITFGPPPKIVAPPPPVPVAAKSEPKAAKSEPKPRPVETSLLFSNQPIAELAAPVEPRRRVPVGVSLLCLLSVAGSIAIVALKLLP